MDETQEYYIQQNSKLLMFRSLSYAMKITIWLICMSHSVGLLLDSENYTTINPSELVRMIFVEWSAHGNEI